MKRFAYTIMEKRETKVNPLNLYLTLARARKHLKEFRLSANFKIVKVKLEWEPAEAEVKIPNRPKRKRDNSDYVIRFDRSWTPF